LVKHADNFLVYNVFDDQFHNFLPGFSNGH